MAELKYIPQKPWTFDHRLDMCKAVADYEGTEIGDILGNLIHAARQLHAFTDYQAEMVLLIAEQICYDYVHDVLWARQCDWEEYKDFDSEVYAHFNGGAKKLTEEEFERKS